MALMCRTCDNGGLACGFDYHQVVDDEGRTVHLPCFCPVLEMEP